MKEFLLILSVVVGALAYIYMVVKTMRGSGEGLSFSTFGLWSGLAWIAYFTSKDNQAIPLIYGLGATATTLVLIAKGRFAWKWTDTIVTILVLICVWLWLIQGTRQALIASTIGGVIAAIPFIVMAWKAPDKSPIIANAGFTVANILFFLSGKTWTFEDRFYGAANAVGCSLLVIPWVIHRLRK